MQIRHTYIHTYIFPTLNIVNGVKYHTFEFKSSREAVLDPVSKISIFKPHRTKQKKQVVESKTTSKQHLKN